MTELQTVQALNAIRQRAQEITPELVADVYDRLHRGGHGSRSMGEPSRQAETPIPVTQRVTERDDEGNPTRWGPIVSRDALDRELKQRSTRYAKHLMRALAELDAAHREQSWFLTPVDENIPDPDVPCANTKNCGNVLEAGRKTGECGRCRKWRYDHDGLPYPSKREEGSP